MQVVSEDKMDREIMDAHEENLECRNNVEYRCDAFSSSAKDRIMLRSIKFVEMPDQAPDCAVKFDMTYCVVELSPNEAEKLAGKLMTMSRNVQKTDINDRRRGEEN